MKRLAILAALALSACAHVQFRHIASAAAAQCPNGANDWDAYRDSAGRLHVDAGCD